MSMIAAVMRLIAVVVVDCCGWDWLVGGGRGGRVDRAMIIEVIVQLAMTVSVLGGCVLCTVGGKKYM